LWINIRINFNKIKPCFPIHNIFRHPATSTLPMNKKFLSIHTETFARAITPVFLYITTHILGPNLKVM
jgi:hypothetical protein